MNEDRNRRGKPKYNVFSRLLFCWLDPLFCFGLRHTVDSTHLYAHPIGSESSRLLNRFNRYWSVELYRRSKGSSPRLLVALLKCIWWKVLLYSILITTRICLVVAQSVLIGYIADYFSLEEPTDEETRIVYLQAMGMSVLAFLIVLINGHSVQYSRECAMDIKAIIISAINKKVLSLKQTTISQLTTGHIINLASNDAHRFDYAFLYFACLWIAPVHLIVFTYLMYLEVGASSFLATGLLVAQIPVLMGLANLYSKLRLKAARLTDQRIKVMNEVITGIRVIKMYTWEYAFKKMVNNIRRSEVWLILKGSLIRGLTLAHLYSFTPVIMFAVFSVYTFTGGELTPKKVFTALSLLIFIRVTSVYHLTQTTVFCSEAYVALKRIKSFLLMDDISTEVNLPIVVAVEDQLTHATNPMALLKDCHLYQKHGDCAYDSVIVDKLCASWNMDRNKLTLSNISFTMNKKAPLLLVVGPVAAGKSTLLQCLLNELPAVSGSVSVNGGVAYSSQEPWVYSDTVRNNILFGLSYQPTWYQNVVEACALENDFKLLPDGDLTLVGERGVTLSGGQKARINLARAVYRNADVYLLDDPLSAVDSIVSRHLFDKCIKGVLSEKCVVLVTHQLQYVQECDNVLMLKEGMQFYYGSISNLAINGIEIMKYLTDKNQLEDMESVQCTHDCELPKAKVDSETSDDQFSVMSTPPDHQVSLSSCHTDNKDNELVLMDGNEHVKEMAPEMRAYGRVTFKTYYKYFTTRWGHLLAVMVLVLILVGEASIVVNDWWLAEWANCNSSNSTTCSLTTHQHIGVYGGLTVLVLILSYGRTILFFVMALRSSCLLHNEMFGAVLRSPVLFFDTNPVGRVLNRFSKDIGFLDDVLPFFFCEILLYFANCGFIFLTAMISNYFLIIALTIIMFALLGLRWYYLYTAREIKRIEALARSPIYSHLSATIEGLPVIRSFSMQLETMNQCHKYLNAHTQAWYMTLVSERWFGMRIQVLGSIFVVITMFSSIPLAESLNAGLVGLALAYMIQLSNSLQYSTRQSAEVENLMVSAERVMGYCGLNSEAPLETSPSSAKPPPDWPTNGGIELNNITYRHSPDGPLVFKGISATIFPSEKIGIVGRTGAGKSSLIATLFRLAEPNGSIKIAGVECLGLGLHDLRSKISIICQDPVLFSGTIRYNLDPFQQYTDHELWKALEQVQLKSVVEALEGELDAALTEKGDNFSVGQKQLFCLARALLNRKRILILDEATANVDLQTDAIIQNVIRQEFKDVTILTIAHRLDTVMDCNRIMVLGAGQILEFGAPHELLSNTESHLSKLVNHTGTASARKLKSMTAN